MKTNSNKQSWLVVSQLQSFTLGLWSRKGTAAGHRRSGKSNWWRRKCRHGLRSKLSKSADRTLINQPSLLLLHQERGCTNQPRSRSLELRRVVSSKDENLNLLYWRSQTASKEKLTPLKRCTDVGRFRLVQNTETMWNRWQAWRNDVKIREINSFKYLLGKAFDSRIITQ